MIKSLLQLLALLCLLAAPQALKAQSTKPYESEMGRYRQHYKEEFITDDHSPLKAEDTGKLVFTP